MGALTSGRTWAKAGISGNSTSIEFSVGAYFLLGFELSIGIDLKAWNNELISIFEESISYGK